MRCLSKSLTKGNEKGRIALRSHESSAFSFPFLDEDADKGRLGELAVNEANLRPPFCGPAVAGELLPLVRVGELGRDVFARVGDIASFEFASVSKNSTHNREKDLRYVISDLYRLGTTWNAHLRLICLF
jgi:hypothetical protein